MMLTAAQFLEMAESRKRARRSVSGTASDGSNIYRSKKAHPRGHSGKTRKVSQRIHPEGSPVDPDKLVRPTDSPRTVTMPWNIDKKGRLKK